MRKDPDHSFMEKLLRKPPLLILAGYLLVLFLGASLLLLPAASRQGRVTSPLTALFTACSALCVTGLTTVTTAVHWSSFGQVVILLLIQLGGLGIVTAATAILMALRRPLSMQERMVIAEEKGAATPGGMARLIRFILAVTFLFEGLGVILLAIRFVPRMGWGQGIWMSVFHAVSAFCNAGFDLLGPSSLLDWQGDGLVLLTLSFLIILGGLGFPVYRDLKEGKRWRHFRLHTKIVLTMTALLLLLGCLLFQLLEGGSGGAWAQLPVARQWLNAFFQSVTCRTAGFASVPQASLSQASVLVAIGLMFIGGSPVSTAGGIKTTTVFALIRNTQSQINPKRGGAIFGRRLPGELMAKASAIALIAVTWSSAAVFILTVCEPQLPFIDGLYEVISAFGTVGLTRNLTPTLGTASQLTLILTMLFGKMGPLTALYALGSKKRPTSTFKEAEESIVIG